MCLPNAKISMEGANRSLTVAARHRTRHPHDRNRAATGPGCGTSMCNQIRCVDEARFGKTYGHVSPGTMAKVDEALKISLALA
jgi:mRNA-degrading endonuclease toxin of MazEF toxin-antitoxin module